MVENTQSQGSVRLKSSLESRKVETVTISAVSAFRYVMDSSSSVFSDDAVGRLELDTHADTCVAGANTLVLDLTGKTVSVSPFCESEYEAIEEIPVATVVKCMCWCLTSLYILGTR